MPGEIQQEGVPLEGPAEERFDRAEADAALALLHAEGVHSPGHPAAGEAEHPATVAGDELGLLPDSGAEQPLRVAPLEEDFEFKRKVHISEFE